MGNKSLHSTPEKEGGGFGSAMSTYLHIVCITVGAGIYYLPSAVTKGGWVNIIIMFFFSVLSYYSGSLVVKCLYYKEDEKLETLSDIGYHSFGRCGSYVSQACFCLIIFGSAWVYLILCGKNLVLVLQGVSNVSLNIWLIIFGFVVLVPLLVFKSIKEAAVLSLFAVLATLFAVVTIAIYSAIEINKGVSNAKEIGFFQLDKTASALSSFAFAYGGSYLYPQIVSSMKDKSKWPISLLSSMISIYVIYAVIVVLGMFAFGLNTKSPIYENLPQDSWVVKVVLVMITLHFIFAIPIFICSVCLELESKINITVEKLGKKKELIYRGAFRTVVVILLTVIAILINDSEFASNLIGAIPTMFVICIMPVICYFKLYGYKNKSALDYVGCGTLLLVGVFCMVYGTYESIIGYINKQKNQ